MNVKCDPIESWDYISALFENSNLHSQLTDEEFESAIDRIISTTFNNFAKSYDYQGINNELERAKRSTDLLKSIDKNSEVYEFKDIKFVSSLCANATGIETIKYFNNTVAACYSVITNQIILGIIDKSIKFIPIPSIKPIITFGRMNLAMFVSNNLLYMVVSDEGKDFSPIDTFEIYRNWTLIKRYSPTLKYPSKMIISYPVNYENKFSTIQGSTLPHLIISSRTERHGTRSYKSITEIFHWQVNRFDLFTKVDSFMVKDICSFSIQSSNFIAIINHKAGLNHHQVDSEIFRLDSDNKYHSIQKIRTYGAVDCEYFSLGENDDLDHFLAITNNYDVIGSSHIYKVNSVVYKFSFDRFVPFQCFETDHALMMKAFKDTNGQFVLALADWKNVKFYQYNGWIFEQVFSLNIGVESISTLSIEGNNYMLTNSIISRQLNVYKINFKLNNFYHKWYKGSLERCHNILEEAEKTNISELETLFADLYFIDSKKPIIIHGDLTFESTVNITGTLSAPKIKVKKQNYDFLNNEYIKELKELENQLNKLEKAKTHFESLLSKTMKIRHAGYQEVTGSYSFSNAEFKCGHNSNCTIQNINASNLNNFELSDLENQLYFTNKPEKVNKLEFNRVIFKQNIQAEIINNVNREDIVTKTGSHYLKGPLIFEGDVYIDQLVSNKSINGREINYNTVLVSNKNQKVYSELNFDKEIEINKLKVFNKIPSIGLTLDDYLDSLVVRNDKRIIYGRKTFNKIYVDNLIMDNANISGIDISRLYHNALWKSGNQNIHAPLTVDYLTLNDLKVKTINGVPFKRSNFVLTTGNNIIKATKHFYRPLKAKYATVRNSINGLEKMNCSLNFMLKSKPQIVTGPKVFTNIHLRSNAYVSGAVDGVHLKLLANLLERSKNAIIKFDNLTIDKDITINDIKIHKKLNDKDLNDFFKNALKISQFKDLNITKIRAKSVNCKKINGFDLQNHFLTKNTNQNIKTNKYIRNVLVKNLNIKFINNHEVRSINDSLKNNISQSIIGKKTIVGNLFLNNLKVNFFNGVNMNDLVLINQVGIINDVKLRFENIKVKGNLFSSSINGLEKLNEISWFDLYENSLRSNYPQNIGVAKFFNVSIPYGENLNVSFINNNRFDLLINNSVYLNSHEPQHVHGQKIFIEDIEVKELNFLSSLDGITPSEIDSKWMKLHGDQIINGNIVFEHDLKVDDIEVNGKINGFDVSNLLKIVRKDKPLIVDGITRLAKVQVEGNVDGIINNLNIKDEIVRKTGKKQFISGVKEFLGGLHILKKLNLFGSISGISLQSMCNKVAYKDSTNYFSHLTVDTLETNEIVTSSWNRIDMELAEKSCLLSNHTVIKGKKHFKHLIVNGDIFLSGKLNNLDINNLSKSCLRKTKNQIIDIPVHFDRSLQVNGITYVFGDLIPADNMINGVNIKELNANKLKLNNIERHKRELIFQGPVKAKSIITPPLIKLQGKKVNLTNLMLKNKLNVFKSPIVFDSVNFQNVEMPRNQTIHGIFIENLKKYLVLNNATKEVVRGLKHFNSLDVDELDIKSPINGIIFDDESVLRNDKEVIINSSVKFSNLVALGGVNTSGSVNGYNLNQLATRFVKKDEDNIILEPVYFNTQPLVRYFVTDGLVDRFNLSDTLSKLKNPLMKSITQQLDFHDKKLDKLKELISSRSSQLDYYIDMVTFNGMKLLEKSRGSNIFTGFYAIESSPYPCKSLKLIYYDMKRYEVFEVHKVFNPIRVLDFQIGKESYVMIASSNADSFSKPNYLWKCMENFQLLTNVTIKGNSLIQILKIDKQKNRFSLLSLKSVDDLSDINILETYSKTTCFIMAIYSINRYKKVTPTVFCPTSTGILVEEQRLSNEALGTKKLVTFSSNYLACSFVLALKGGLYEKNQIKKFPIYHMCENEKKLTFLQSLIGYHFSNAHFCEFSDMLYLILSENKTPIGNRALVRIYQYQEKFLEIQQIIGLDVISIESVLMPDLVVFIMTTDSLRMYKLSGVSGFQSFGNIPTRDSNRFTIIGHIPHNLILSSSENDNEFVKVLIPKMKS